MARSATGVDVGLTSAQLLRGTWKGNTFHVSDFALAEYDPCPPEQAWSRLALHFKPTAARVGLTGKACNLRYSRVPRVPDWQLRKLMGFEVAEIGDQSGTAVASDFNLLPPLPEIEGEDVVLLAMARESLLEVHAQGLAEAGGKLDAFAPNALALYNAWVRYGVIEEETVLLANVGHENLDLCLVRGPDLVFARNLSGGSKLFDDAIAERFGVSERKAGEIKRRLVDLTPGARFSDANGEKASRAAQAAAGQLLSLLQSAVMFAKGQVKLSNLRLDKVLLCGGGALLPGLCEYLANGMGVPVEHFDPFRVVETSALPPEDAELLSEKRLSCVVALGLATMAAHPESYSIEILPERLRRRREFWTGPALALAAALLAVLFLALDGLRGSARLRSAESELRAVGTQWSRADRTHRETEQLLEENAGLAEQADELFELAGSGEEVARVLAALEKTLPELFWVTHLSSDWRTADHLGLEREDPAPAVHVEGRAREGATTVAEEYERFVSQLEAELPGAEVDETLDLARNQFTLDVTHFQPTVAEAAAEDSSAGAE